MSVNGLVDGGGELQKSQLASSRESRAIRVLTLDILAVRPRFGAVLRVKLEDVKSAQSKKLGASPTSSGGSDWSEASHCRYSASAVNSHWQANIFHFGLRLLP